MSTDTHRRSPAKVVAAAAVAAGLAAGSYGIANAASGSGSGSTGSAVATQGSSSASAATANAQQPWGRQRSDETLLTGDTETKVTNAAVAEVAGATVVRVETDADGHAKYEAHMVKSDGTPVTVYVDAQFDVVSVETR